MEITLAGQTWLFLGSIAVGAALGAVYDLLRILRLAFRHSVWVVMAEDILFSVVCAAVTFLFVLGADDGQLRLFVLIGELIGFALYRCTIGVLVIGVARRLIEAVRRVFSFFYRRLVAPIYRLYLRLWCFLFKNMKNTTQLIKNKAKKSKIHLQPCKHLLYNLAKRSTGKNEKFAAGQERTK